MDKTNEMKKENKFKSFFKKALANASNVLFPPNIKCIVCGEDLPQKQEIEICDNCFKFMQFIDEKHCCLRCGELITGQGHLLFKLYEQQAKV